MQLTFTSSEVVVLIGISPCQLQWWDEQGIAVPDRDGRRRIYSLGDLVEMALLSELRQRGFSLQSLRRVIRFQRQQLGKRLVGTVTAASEYHLLIDGRNIFLEGSARGVVDLLKNARQPMLTVCLSDAIQRTLSPRERGCGARAATPGARSTRRPPSRVMAHDSARRNGSVRHLKERGSKAS